MWPSTAWLPLASYSACGAVPTSRFWIQQKTVVWFPSRLWILGCRLSWKRVKNDPMRSVLLEFEAHQLQYSPGVQTRAAAWSPKQLEWGHQHGWDGSWFGVLGILAQSPGGLDSRPAPSEMDRVPHSSDGSSSRAFSGYWGNTVLRKSGAHFL